jgi:hypothetical protein
VLVEAVPFPKGFEPAEPATLLQAWPEPRLQWQTTGSVKVTAATDAGGAKLAAEPGTVADPKAEPGRREGVVMVRNPDGTAKFVRDTGPAFQLAGTFSPSPRQAVVRFKPGDAPPTEAKELAVSLFATVRTGVEPLSRIGGLEPNKPATGVGVSGVELTATYRKGEKGKWVAVVALTYDSAVQMAGVGDELAGVKGGGPGVGNQTVFGIRVTDADGKPFTPGLLSGTSGFEAYGKRVVIQATLELNPDKDGQGPPAAVTFWGTHAKPVEIPVILKNVPLSGK